ncbi:hypothetical protein M6D81_05555 [Paenibacillus sp. J5C_2022]|uniref:hypothetical protein n=1 Tax=Paenibacillus sp. J5C2022 TaxID=2977129 RepID=UPI0021D1D7AC|nr:hypothetical protein [Paenibacillus sp. J5C2022]MCU6708172.1 hypothetical protein [Paenibacillus sp. J5C2022]
MNADNAYVLTEQDVNRIRSYVHAKYAAAPHERRAEIVADAVTRIIYRGLPEFEPDVRQRMTATLIRTTVLEQQRPVCRGDILELCRTLDQQDEAIAAPLRQWMNRTSIAGAGIDAAASGTAEIIPLHGTSKAVSVRRQKRFLLYGALSLGLVSAVMMYGWSLSDRISAPSFQPSTVQQQSVEHPVERASNELPAELQYKPIDEVRLASYLNRRNSVLADQEYMLPIIDAAEQFNIHPLLLFAITGQEQAFVPRSHERAEKIANNPFNVFHSWQQFNTSIKESAEIASRTIVRLSKDKPQHTDPIAWINREYAEDPNWSKGVTSLLRSMTAYMEAPHEEVSP